MKKVFDFKLPIRLLSLLLGVIMLCTCLSTGIYSVTASNNTDGAFKLIGRSNYTEIDNDCYEVSLFPWESATTVRKVDLTKGFYFTVDGFADNSDWLRIAFIKDLENEERYASDVKIRYADGILCCDEFKNGIVYFSTSFYASDRVHFMQARPVTNNDAVTGYSIYIDGKPFNSNGFTISLEDFNYYNNYNSQTGEFDGCHLEMLALGTPKVGIWTPTEERFTGSFDGAFSYIENAKGFDDITLGNKGRANSTWQFDFLDGVKFAVDGLEENNGNDFVTVGFSANLWELRKGNFAGNIDKSFKLKNVDGKLAISVFNGTQYGSYSTLKIDVSKPYTLKAVEVSVGDETLYNFYIGGCEIKEFSMTEDEFYNFNYATGGVYVGFSANTGAELKDVCKAVLGDSPFIETANFSSVNKNGSYDMKFGGQGIAISNWQTDLTKGIIFSMDDFTNDDGTDWLQLVFLADNKKTHEVYPVGVIIKQRNGQLYAAATDGFGEWCTTFFGPAVGTHLLKAVPLEGSGENFYRLTIDGKDFSGVFAIPEQDFKNINNHNQTDDTFTGTHIKFMASQGVKFSVFVPGDAAFVGEDGFTYTTTDNGKYNLSLAEDGYAITSWQAELTEGIAFNVEKLNGVVSLRLANNLWLMSREDGIPTKNRQPLIKLKEENGALYACVSDDDATENYSLLKDVSVSGEHILSAKKSVLAGSEETVYRLYIDNVEIDGSYYLSLEDFNLINNYDAPSDIFTGATVRFAATKAVVINNIYKAVDFEGGDFTYREVSEGHYNLNVGYYSYAYSKWKADMTAGIAFNVEYANGWIMIRFCNDFETMGIDEVANTYQPVLLLRNDEDGLYAAIMNGLMHKSATKLKGVTLTGTHILNAKLAPDRTGVMCYRFYLDGMPIVKDYTMSTSVVKKINGYNKEKGIFEGAQVYFSSQNGAIINDIYKLTTGETVTNGIWDTASDAKVTKVGDNTYDMDMKALSSLRSSLAVNIEKGITITAQNGTNFGIALSMLPGGTLLDVPPVIADTNGIYYSFNKTADNTYRIISSSGLSADWTGDLSGKHVYSMAKIIDQSGKEKYTLAIDGKAVFDDGMERAEYIKFSNGSTGSYPTVFTKDDEKIQLTGEFIKITSVNTDNLWDDDWDAGSDDFDEWYDEEEEEDSFLEDDDLLWDDEEEDFFDEEEDPETTTKRVLVKRVKIDQDPIVKYEMNWWMVVVAVAAVILIIGGIFTFVPFKKKEDNQEIKNN